MIIIRSLTRVREIFLKKRDRSDHPDKIFTYSMGGKKWVDACMVVHRHLRNKGCGELQEWGGREEGRAVLDVVFKCRVDVIQMEGRYSNGGMG